MSPARGTDSRPCTWTGRDGVAADHGVAVLVGHGTHAAVGRARHDRVADPERARLDEHGRHGAAALVELRLDGDAARVLVGVRAQVETGVGGEQHRVEQVLDADVLARRHVDEHDIAAVLLGHETELGELLAHLRGVGVGLVDLVHRDHDRHVGRLGVVQRLDRLRHDAVVGRDHEDRDVGHLRTTGTHGGERLVARGVDEGDRAVDALVLGVHLVRTDVLGDAAGLARDDVRVADGVEEAGLAVVDVAHDGDDRRTLLEVLVGLVLELLVEVDVEALEELPVLVLGRDDLDLVAELGAEHLEGGLVERLGRGGHLTEVEQHRDERTGVRVDLVGEVGDRGAATQADDGVAVAAGDAHAAERRGLPHLEFLPLRALRLAGLALAAAAAEGTGRAAAGTATTTAAARGTRAAEAAAGRAAGHWKPPPAPPGRHRRHRRRRDAGSHRRRRDDRRRAAGTRGTRDGAPGRGAWGRGMLPGLGRWPMPCELEKGLLPGRGWAGRWPMPCELE